KDNVKSMPVLKYLVIFFNWLYDTAIDILNFPIKVWWLLFICMVLYVTYKVFKSVRQKQIPDYINYNKDVFKNWIWRWEWKLKSGDWTITNLTAYCPKDDVQLIDNGDFFRNRCYCPKCNA